jgi:hypothetical protein
VSRASLSRGMGWLGAVPTIGPQACRGGSSPPPRGMHGLVGARMHKGLPWGTERRASMIGARERKKMRREGQLARGWSHGGAAGQSPCGAPVTVSS